MSRTKLLEGDSVAVIDDVREDAELTADLIGEAGFEPKIICPPPSSIEVLLEEIRKNTRAVICDHRLTGRANVRYHGAEVVAKSNEAHVPAVLITTYADVDTYSIRLWRSRIPRLLRRGRHSDPDAMTSALLQAEKEQVGEFEPDRVGYRTVVRVANVRTREGLSVAEVIISAWNPAEAVEIPTELITRDVDLAERRLPDMRFMAKVNIYAESPDELYFESFEVAPPIPREWLP
ncbi:MAG: hypothetical protein QG608_1983 [Actinomycetota bacterium]|nr:hypothetical protein [Actinomycetota bacterium]